MTVPGNGVDQIEGRIGIDARALAKGPAGIATYVRNLLREIPQLDPLVHPWPRNNLLWNHLRVPGAQIARRWSLYHAASYTSPLLNFCPVVLTAPDISYLVCEQWYPYRLDVLRRLYYEASLKRADRIIVTSDFSRTEVVRLFPQLEQRVRRTYPGVSRSFSPDSNAAAAVRRELDLPEDFILHVGDIHTRRNLHSLVAAAKRLDMPVVLVGKILRGGEWLADWPHLFSDLSLDQLRGVYSAAAVFAYPSLYEGFGFPPLEAMACGCPVVASNRTSIPEVCGAAAVIVEPDEDSLVDGIRQALDDREYYIKSGLAHVRGFRWETTAAQTRQIYRELL